MFSSLSATVLEMYSEKSFIYWSEVQQGEDVSMPRAAILIKPGVRKLRTPNNIPNMLWTEQAKMRKKTERCVYKVWPWDQRSVWITCGDVWVSNVIRIRSEHVRDFTRLLPERIALTYRCSAVLRFSNLFWNLFTHILMSWGQLVFNLLFPPRFHRCCSENTHLNKQFTLLLYFQLEGKKWLKLHVYGKPESNREVKEAKTLHKQCTKQTTNKTPASLVVWVLLINTVQCLVCVNRTLVCSPSLCGSLDKVHF